MKKLALVLFALLPVAALARPTTYAGGWMGMVMHDGAESSASLTYSPSIRDAIGLRTDYMQGDDAWMETINYNHLLKRWNMAGSQGNFYVLSGIGVAEKGDSSNVAGWMGMEADWESRRYYVAYENRGIASGLIDEEFTQKARVGVAPILRKYDEVQPWFMLQVDHRPQGTHEFAVTPLVRFYTPEMLVEAGVSNHGDVLFNLTGNF